MALVFACRVYMLPAAEKALAEEIAGLDNSDPRWRWDEIQEDRQTLADENNSALCVLRARALLSDTPRLDEDTATSIANLQGNETLFAAPENSLRSYLRTTAPAVKEARRLANLPNGRYPIDWKKPVLMNSDLNDLQRAREVVYLLKYDAYLAAQDRDMNRAITSCHAAVNAGRSIGDEPTMMPLLLRLACGEVAVTALQRVLGQGESSVEALTSLQDLLEAEANEPFLYRAIRGERAMMFESLHEIQRRGGQIADLYAGMPTAPAVATSKFRSIFGPVRMLRIQEEWLKWLTHLMEISKLTCGQQEAEFRKLGSQYKVLKDDQYLAGQVIMLPAWSKIVRAQYIYLARLSCTITALAMERYRLDKGDWPKTLDTLVPNYLIQIPEAPFGSGTVQLKSSPDGFVLHSSVQLNDGERGFAVIADDPHLLGFRLWNPDKRHRAALLQ